MVWGVVQFQQVGKKNQLSEKVSSDNDIAPQSRRNKAPIISLPCLSPLRMCHCPNSKRCQFLEVWLMAQKNVEQAGRQVLVNKQKTYSTSVQRVFFFPFYGHVPVKKTEFDHLTDFWPRCQQKQKVELQKSFTVRVEMGHVFCLPSLHPS